MKPITSERLDANWRGVAAELDAPRPMWLERALRRLGVPSTVTRVIAATPALRRSWFVAIGVTVLIGLGTADSADPRGSLLVLLIAAPLLPVLGVALAYGPSSDPVHEVQVAMPMPGARLLAVRALTVFVTAVVIVVPISTASDVVRPMAAAWLLPALATTAATLATMTVLSPRRATTVVALCWVTLVIAVRAAADDPLAAFGMVGQVVSVAVAVVAVGVVIGRRTSFDLLHPRPGELLW